MNKQEIKAAVRKMIDDAPIEFDDNYQIRLRKRAEVLTNRRGKLFQSRGIVEYENGVAARFFPNVHFDKEREKRLIKIRRIIDEELKEIYEIL